MSFQFLNFSKNRSSQSKDNSPHNAKTPHVRLKEDDPEDQPFPGKGVAKYNDKGATAETMNHLKTFGSPHSLNMVVSPKSPSNPKNMVPPTFFDKSANRKSLQPQSKRLLADGGKSGEDIEDRGVSTVLQDFSLTKESQNESQANKNRSNATKKGNKISEFKIDEKIPDEPHNENTKHEQSKSGVFGASFADSRRTLIMDDKSPRSKRPENLASKSALDDCDEEAEQEVISEEGENNISLCSCGSGNGDNDNASPYSKFSPSVQAKQQSSGAFSNLRNLNLKLPDEPAGSQTHRGKREEEIPYMVNNNANADNEPVIEEDDEGYVNEPDSPVQQEQHEHHEEIQVLDLESQNSPPTVDMEKLANLDASLSLRKACGLCITIILSSYLLLSMIKDHESYRLLFTVIYVFLAYIAVENGLRLRSQETQFWKRKDRFFDFVEVLALLFFQFCIDLYLMGVVSHVTTAFAPLLVTTVAYYIFSTAPRSTKDVKALSRLLMTCQALLICLQLSGYLDWEWAGVVAGLWIYFSFSAIYAVMIAILLIAVIFAAIFKVQSFTTSSLITRAIGLLWYATYNGLSILALAVLVGMAQAYDFDDADSTVLEKSLTLTLYVSCGILAYNVVLFAPLKNFVKTFEENQNMVSPNDAIVENIQPRHVLDFQVEKAAPSYFVMLSSTYFLPLHEGFLSKSRERFHRMKSTTLSTKISLSKSKSTADSATGPSKALVIEELKKDKEVLDHKLDGSPQTLKSSLTKTFDLLKLKKIGSGLRNSFKNDTAHFEEGQISLAVENKLAVSVDDMYDMSPFCKNRAPIEEENTCYICFDRLANAVLMDCGHAGICCECAINMIKDKNECMECRKPVKAVYKVDRNLKATGIVKGSELTKVVEFGDL